MKQVPDSKLQLGTEELLTSQQEDRKRGRNAGRQTGATAGEEELMSTSY